MARLSPPLRLLALVMLALAARSAGAQRKTPARAPSPAPARPYVVLVSFDGFRADYLDSVPTEQLQRLARRGTRASALVPVFPSKTFPNHYAIATGMYAEHHGVVANTFWDPVRKARYALSDTLAVRDGTWYRGEPIWVTAERQRVRAASFYWPGSEADIGRVRPSIYKRYDASVPDSVRVDSVLAWLRLPPATRPHLVTLYASDADDVGHKYGPLTPRVAGAVGALDRMLGRLMDGLDALPMRDSVYLVVVSEHGMARYTPEHFVALDAIVDTTGVRLVDGGPHANLFVAGGPARARLVRDSLERGLGHGHAYLRAEVPAELHYRADPRIGDVVVVMEMPYLIGLSSNRPKAPAGSHGWMPSNPAMQGIFLVSGPGIRQGARVGTLRNIDVYPFLTELLRLRPAAGIDGEAGRICRLVAVRPGAGCGGMR